MRVTKATILVIACLVLSSPPAAPNAFGQQSGQKNLKSAEQELIRLTNELLRAAVDDDAAPLERLLDDNYVSIDFGNKSKDKATLIKLWTTKNPKETAKSTITADDFQFHFYGDTAIVAYKITDVFRGNKGEQTFHDHSFDVWKKSGKGWHLVSSSTAALLPGRQVVALDAKTLDAYAGVYQSPEGDTFSITREGEKLLVSISDGTKFDLAPQTELEFYSPSNSMVSMFFVRDEQGRVAYAIARFYGSDTTIKKIK